jgi:cell division protein FtsL
MPRKIRTQKSAPARKITRGEKILYIVTAIIAVSMVFGTIFSAMAAH